MEGKGRPNRRIRVLHALNRVLSRIYHHVEVSGELRVPRHGPAIIIGNHISGLDPLLIQSVVERPIAWMMAREYYEIAPLKWIFESIQAIPVSRDGRDSAGLRTALRTLEQGNLLGIFPEGKIALGREILPFETGVAMIALRTGVPVVPVYQTGTTRGWSLAASFLLPQTVRLRFGEAIELKKEFGRTKSLEAPTARLEQAMARLRDELSHSRGG